jgi:hypothetical protein
MILSRREIFVKKIISLDEGNFNLSPGKILGCKNVFLGLFRLHRSVGCVQLHRET